MNHNDPTPAVHVKRGRLRKRKKETWKGPPVSFQLI